MVNIKYLTTTATIIGLIFLKTKLFQKILIKLLFCENIKYLVLKEAHFGIVKKSFGL